MKSYKLVEMMLWRTVSASRQLTTVSVIVTCLLLVLSSSATGQAQQVRPSEKINIHEEVQVSVILHGPQVVRAGEVLTWW